MVNTIYQLWTGLWEGMQSVANLLNYEVAGIPLITIIFGSGIGLIITYILIKWVLDIVL